MSGRFGKVSRRLPSALEFEQSGTVVRARCHYCRKNDTMQSSGGRHRAPPEEAHKFFIHRGWTGLTGKKPACPACVSKFRAIKAREREEKTAMKEVGKTAGPVVDKEVQIRTEAGCQTPLVAQMGRADRRKVFRAIDEAYSEDGGGYVGGETDHTVASAAGVPVVWVERIREEEFGPAVNEDARKLEADLAAISTKARKAEEDALAAAALAEEASKEAVAWGKRFARLRDAMGPKGARV
ncbi:hypothetical protein [Oceanicella sp. SM1341]|uniref:hypothetical protein n=1 Tax=Oceanicella sp. SM1341 TaxID=1548889 RepID=UPI00130077A5|nr:hypothetical protein [Oceanicella sp. SM1341]